LVCFVFLVRFLGFGGGCGVVEEEDDVGDEEFDEEEAAATAFLTRREPTKTATASASRSGVLRPGVTLGKGGGSGLV